MKLVLPFLFQIYHVAADWSTMTEAYEAGLEKLKNSTDDRNLADIWGANNWSLFSRYGCWCHFDDAGVLKGNLNNRHGLGRPVDELDEYCRILQWGYDCLLMESDANGYVMAEAIDPANNGAPCVPWEVQY